MGRFAGVVELQSPVHDCEGERFGATRWRCPVKTVKNPNEPKLRNTGNMEGSTVWRVRILVALTGIDDDGGPGTTTSD